MGVDAQPCTQEERTMFSNAVVTAVDDEPGHEESLRWAVDDARRRSSELVVLVPRVETSGVPSRRVHQVHHAAIAAARAALGTDLAVVPVRTPWLEPIVEASAGASVVVVHPGVESAREQLLFGSLARDIAFHTAVPVVVVRGESNEGGPVVVGVDSWPGASTAVRFGFQEARMRGVPVLAVSVSTGADAGTHGLQHLELELQELSARYSGVPFEVLRVHGVPWQALTEASDGAQLLVLASRPVVATIVPRPWSTTRHLVLTSACPVALVRQGAWVPQNAPGRLPVS
jgi:nucleotide-binding universal stress UspA family protein